MFVCYVGLAVTANLSALWLFFRYAYTTGFLDFKLYNSNWYGPDDLGVEGGDGEEVEGVEGE